MFSTLVKSLLVNYCPTSRHALEVGEWRNFKRNNLIALMLLFKENLDVANPAACEPSTLLLSLSNGLHAIDCCQERHGGNNPVGAAGANRPLTACLTTQWIFSINYASATLVLVEPTWISTS